MLTPLADSPRLHLHVTDVLRQQAVEAVQLAREVRRDRDLIDAVEGMVGRIRDTARALGLVHVERAALRALRGLRSLARSELLDELLEACTGGLRAAPLLRPIVVVSAGQDTAALHRAAQAMAASIRIVPDLATAQRVAESEDAAAIVMPIAVLRASEDAHPLRHRLLFASGREEDVPSRLLAAQRGAAQYLPEPLDLRLVVRLVRGRLAAWRRSAWRVLVADRTRDRVADLAAALASEEIHTIPAVGGYKLLQAIEETGPDLLVVSAPLDNMPVAELTAMLQAHHRFGSLPRLFLWEGGLMPTALTGHDVVQGVRDVPALRARVLAALDDRRRERALREHDELTGVLSAAAILNAADREIAVARRRAEAMVAVRFELDDALGLEARAGAMGPDQALRLLAQTVLGTVRETDGVGVISGTGVLLLMPGCTASHARERIAAVRQRFTLRVANEANLGGTTFSIGLAEGMDDVLLRAERQLLLAMGLGTPASPSTPATQLRLRMGKGPIRVGPDID